METDPANSEHQRDHYNKMRPILGDEITDSSIEIYDCAGFEISIEASRPFEDFVRWINTRPQFISEWRSDIKKEQTLYPKFMTVTDGVRSAYAAVCYHLMRIKKIEVSIDNILSRYDFSSRFNQGQVAAFGNMRQLDFEYHAFVIAYRRCLDYLSCGISTYFKQSQSSYNRFKKTLERGQPRSVAEALIAVYEKHIEKFAFVIGTERGKSLRDRIGHSEFVQAATINVGSDGHRFVGGGENLRISDPNDNRRLSEILDDKAFGLHRCISDFLYSFRDAVILFEDSNKNKKYKGPLSTQYSYYNVDNCAFYINIARSWKIS